MLLITARLSSEACFVIWPWWVYIEQSLLSGDICITMSLSYRSICFDPFYNPSVELTTLHFQYYVTMDQLVPVSFQLKLSDCMYD